MCGSASAAPGVPRKRGIVADDDPQARLDGFGRPSHASAGRRFGTDLTTVRFDFGSV